MPVPAFLFVGMKPKSEKHIQRDIFLAIGSKPTCRIFRNNIGFDHDKKVHYGLHKGSSDLIGLKSLIISPEDVGKRLAVFVAIEVKRPDEKPTEDQKNFINMVRWLGGFAGIATSVEDAERIVNIM